MYDATAVELKTERRSGRDAGVWASGAQASAGPRPRARSVVGEEQEMLVVFTAQGQ